MLIHSLIGQQRALLRLRIHADGCAVDDDVILLDDFRRYRRILDGTRTLVAANEYRLKSKVAQSVVDGFRSTACAQYEGFLVPFLVEHGFYALREADDIRIKTFQLGVVTFVRDANHVDSTDGTGFWRYTIKEGDDLLFIRNGDIESTKIGVGVKNFRQCVDSGNLEILINSIDAFVLELLVEVADGERMTEWIADKSVLVHNQYF